MKKQERKQTPAPAVEEHSPLDFLMARSSHKFGGDEARKKPTVGFSSSGGGFGDYLDKRKRLVRLGGGWVTPVE